MANQETISTKIIRNTKFNMYGYIFGIAVNLVMTPYLLHYLGIERYGLLAVIGALTGYFGLFDMGMSASFVKYLAEYFALDDYKKVNQVVNSAFVFYLVLAILIGIVSVFFLTPILHLFRIPPALSREAFIVFVMGLLLFALSNLVSPFGSLFVGKQRMDIVSAMGVFSSVLNVIGTVYFLSHGYGLIGLMVNNMCILLIGALITVVLIWRMYPRIRFNPFLFDLQMFKRFFSFAYKVQVARFAEITFLQFDKLLISHYLNLGVVSYYQVGSAIISRLRDFALQIVVAIFPAVSELNAKMDRQRILALYERGSKYICVVGVSLVCFAILEASLIMRAWLGHGYEQAMWIMRILAPVYCLNILTGVSTSLAAGLGKVEFQMNAALVHAALNIGLSLLLISQFGLNGLLASITISMTVSIIYFLITFHRFIAVPLVPSIGRFFFKPFLVSLFVSLLLFFIEQPFGVFPGRLMNISLLIIKAVFFFSLFLLILLRVRYFDEYDKKIFLRAFGIR
ncbi:MAG TPA: oligosaccharide flippase family protein [Candidatus Omnitrophota bacterium]|nr:oligosaccharide flippase family protein [Candidatus Omnitrophota bacterium]HPT07399.1 oligosaccharide flippase family protein [Candidatus Omnitrophota bacterium]